jgi:hypothetical protein
MSKKSQVADFHIKNDNHTNLNFSAWGSIFQISKKDKNSGRDLQIKNKRRSYFFSCHTYLIILFYIITQLK